MKTLNHGDIISCRIQEDFIPEARVTISNEGEDGEYRIYICQNHKDGSRCSERWGYDYSWVVCSTDYQEGIDDMFKESPEYGDVFQVKILKRPMINRNWAKV